MLGCPVVAIAWTFKKALTVYIIIIRKHNIQLARSQFFGESFQIQFQTNLLSFGMVLTFECYEVLFSRGAVYRSVDEIVSIDHSRASRDTVYYTPQGGSNFCVCG